MAAVDLASFLVVSVLLILLPGPDMALVARNALHQVGIRATWGSPDVPEKQSLPAYLGPAETKDAPPVADRLEGSRVFALVCGNCHGERGEGGKQAGPLRDPAFLSLVSDQALRRIVITGRIGEEIWVVIGAIRVSPKLR